MEKISKVGKKWNAARQARGRAAQNKKGKVFCGFPTFSAARFAYTCGLLDYGREPLRPTAEDFSIPHSKVLQSLPMQVGFLPLQNVWPTPLEQLYYSMFIEQCQVLLKKIFGQDIISCPSNP